MSVLPQMQPWYNFKELMSSIKQISEPKLVEAVAGDYTALQAAKRCQSLRDPACSLPINELQKTHIQQIRKLLVCRRSHLFQRPAR